MPFQELEGRSNEGKASLIYWSAQHPNQQPANHSAVQRCDRRKEWRMDQSGHREFWLDLPLQLFRSIALDVTAQHLAVALGASLAEPLASLPRPRH